MTHRRQPKRGETDLRAFRLSDHLASLALPVAIIAFGVAVSVESDSVRAFVDLCRTVLP